MSYEIHIIGGGTVGRRIADRLEYRGDTVTVIERDEARAQSLSTDGYRVIEGDGTDSETLDDAGIDETDIVVVATGDDDTNLLAAQLARNRFSVDAVFARVNDPKNEEPFEELGIDTVSQPVATAQIIDCLIESPSMTQWMQSIGQGGEVREVAVENPELTGLTVRELDGHLPDQVLLGTLQDGGAAHLPEQDEVIEHGDRVTVIGTCNPVLEAIDLLGGNETGAPGARPQ